MQRVRQNLLKILLQLCQSGFLLLHDRNNFAAVSVNLLIINISKQCTLFIARCSKTVCLRNGRLNCRRCSGVGLIPANASCKSWKELITIIVHTRPSSSCFKCVQHLKGILHQKKFYRLNLIFWIVMGCDIAHFDRGGPKNHLHGGE